ncbi:hypothetical protein PGT21_026188 [Puccinia graminis f. sp. tritici]|uniref:Uncharacterized protein n=1 Tax=Puccinia graminis f. sp. tritici TaxID=56615 RepID=A0A5B0REU5_PUCGR|nr:hypothetical protein PGT21_026188 [Puccinia graminis f. sp. tritici]KAA1123932.1 hypothetical protein PGTUg99_005237 [Puccinia graminis f. sp. tritici]
MQSDQVELFARAGILLLLAALADPRSTPILAHFKEKALLTKELIIHALRDDVIHPFLTHYELKPIHGFRERYITYAFFLLLLWSICKIWSPFLGRLKQEWESFCEAMKDD